MTTSLGSRGPARQSTTTRVLLWCGIAYSAWYVIGNDVIAASMYTGYSRLDQAVSELSATDAPTRGLLNALVPLAMALLIAFGVGVWRSAGDGGLLRVTGAAFVAQAVTFPIWLLFPMSSRDTMVPGQSAANDIGHIVMTGVTVALILVEIVAGGVAIRDTVFRMFSGMMAVTTFVFGAWTGVMSVDIAYGDPTPWLGLVERLSIGAWLLWIVVLASLLLRRDEPSPMRRRG